MERLYPLKPTSRVWIGRSSSPIPAGTYYRYGIYQNGDIKTVTFKQLSLKETTYSLVTTPVYVEHHFQHFSKDTLAEDYHPGDKNWATFRPCQSPQGIDRVYLPLLETNPSILSAEQIRQIINLPGPDNHPLCTYTPVAKYQEECKILEEKSAGFYVENGRIKDPCPINELVGIFINKALQTTNILWKKTPSSPVHSSTFKLPNIKGIRKLICQS